MTEDESGWNELIGQGTAVELLTQAIVRDRIAPAYLFVGAAGIGKRLAAELFAEQILAQRRVEYSQVFQNRREHDSKEHIVLRQRVRQRNHPDLLWVEPTYLHQGKRVTVSEAMESGLKRRSPPQVRLEQIREIPQFLSRPPLEAKRAVVVLEAAESMGEAAANALLKTLEEPGQATLILIAPSVDSLLPTLISRCQRIAFSRLSLEDLTSVLTALGKTEILSEESILAIAQGSPGEAIASWDRLQSVPQEVLERATQPLTSLRDALDLARQINKSLDTEEQLWLIEYLQQHYWYRDIQPTAIRQLETARTHLLRYVQPRLVWETTFMALLQDEVVIPSNARRAVP